MQLYSECDIGGDHFVSIYGELHVVFAISRAIGKYMKNSGLNKRLSDWYLQVYNPLVVGKIIEGKHMERCVSAIALSCTHPSSRHYLINMWTNSESKEKVR